MPRVWLAVGAFVAGIAGITAQSLAKETDALQYQPQVMLLASFHLANNNRDLINMPIEDVLTTQRQAEVERLVEGLARWKPTRIVLEWDFSDQAGLDQQYQSFLRGELSQSANERNQIGMRLAKRLGHTKVYAADWNESAPGGWAEYDFLSWARDNGAEEELTRFIETEQDELDRRAAIMRGQSISQWYHDLNAPEARLRDHRQYFKIASFGDNNFNPGAAWVGGWYARNLRIFNNIQTVLEPGERVLVLYGSGHIYLLDRFIRETEAAQLIDPLDFIEADEDSSG